MEKFCTIDGCGRRHLAKGLCRKHYDQVPERRASRKAHSQTPESKARLKAYKQTMESKEAQKAYRNTPERKAAQKAYSQNPEYRAAQKARRQTPEAKAAAKAYRKTPEYKASHRVYIQTKLRSDPIFRFIYRIRTLIKISLRNRGFRKSPRTEQILGCSVRYFMAHLASLFGPGMTFENHGEWHIDHIVPLATAKTEADIIRLCHYTNLQPLWAHDNLSKGGRQCQD